MSSLLKQRTKKGKPQDGKQWLHPADLLTDGAVVYPVKLLGITEVAQAKGTEVIKDAITKVQFAKHIKQSEAGKKGGKLRKVDLKISINAIKVDDMKTKEEIYSYPLHHISYCADDKRSKKVFAFIAKDKTCPQHTCYVFECEKMAEELTLTVGQAFELAYRRYLENVGRQKVQAAESVKEGMKQKLSELEKSQESTTVPAEPSIQAPASNRQDDTNLFGDVTPVPGIPPPPPKQTRPAKSNIDAFDPFDISSPTANGHSPSNSLSEFDQQLVAPHTISSPFEDSPSPSPLNKVANPFDQMFELPSTVAVSSGGFDSFDPLDNVSPSQHLPPSQHVLLSQPNTNPPAATSLFSSDLVDNSNPLDATTNDNIFTPQAVQRPRPTPRSNLPVSLPPPPSKQSVKAAKMAAAGQAAGNSPVSPVSAPVLLSNPTPPPQQPSSDLFGLEPTTSPGNPFARPADFDPFADTFDPLAPKPTQHNNNQIQDLQSGFSRGMALDSNDLLS